MSLSLERNVKSSFIPLTGLALGQGFLVTSITHPLEVIKIWQQHQRVRFAFIQGVRVLYQEGGVQAFYRGVHFEAAKLCISQVWKWPLIVYAPHYFESLGVGEMEKPFAVGSTFATAGTVMNFFPQKAKVLAAIQKGSVKEVVGDGFKGIGFFWAKRMVNMSAFLLAQEKLRNNYLKHQKELSKTELVKIGVITAVFVSVVGIPVDGVTTLALSGEKELYKRIKAVGLRFFLKGFAMQMSRSVVFNVSSAFIFDWVKR
jgi:hypothetical protein